MIELSLQSPPPNFAAAAAEQRLLQPAVEFFVNKLTKNVNQLLKILPIFVLALQPQVWPPQKGRLDFVTLNLQRSKRLFCKKL
jgi:hypothetical protein